MVEVARDSSFLTNVASFLETAISTLPSELRNCYGVDQDSREDILKRLLSQGTADVIASLKGSQAKLEIT
jgi:hypothetical protein